MTPNVNALGTLRRCLVVAAVLVASPARGVAQTCEIGTISQITYERLKPFDEEATSPEASLGWMFRGLNSIHVRTMPTVIRWELLFQEGDCLDPLALSESERGLRSLPFIVEARITSEALDDGTHSVHIRIRDAWALSVGVAFTVDNGFQITGLSLNVRNLVGTGTQVGAFRNIYRERSRIGLLVRQPNLLGTRLDVTLHGGETRSGNYVNQSILRPYTGEVGVNAFREAISARDDYFLYSVDPDLGFTQAYLRYEAETYELTYQHRFGSQAGAYFIAGIGASRESVRFPYGTGGYRIVTDNDFDNPGPADTSVIDEIAPQANAHETNRVNVVLGFRNLDFTNLVGLDALTASQDVQSGADLTLTVAPGIPVAGDDVSDMLLRLQGSWGAGTEGVYFAVDGDVQTRRAWDGGDEGRTGWRDFLYEVSGNGYWRQSDGGQLFSRIQLAGASNMDRPFQLTLGGREAVRGYNEDAYPGGRRLLATLEQRALSGIQLGFVDLGLALFADAGKIWAAGVPFGEDTGWKAGVGAGLRVGLPAGSPSVIRIDVSLPVTGDRDEKGTVFRIYAEFLGILDRRSWPSQTERSRWHGVDSDLSTRPVNPLAEN